GPYARQQQQLRRIVGAAGKNDLACRASLFELSVLLVLHRDRPILLDEDSCSGGKRFDRQVGSKQGRTQVLGRRARTATSVNVEIRGAVALAGGTVKVVQNLKAAFARGFHDPGEDDRVSFVTCDGHGARYAVIHGLATPIRLRTAKIRQYVGVSPT